MGASKVFFLQMQQKFVTHLKLMWHPLLIMSMPIIGIGIIQDVVHLQVDVLDA